MSDELLGVVIGAAIGAGVSFLTEWWRRRWDRGDRDRDIAMNRAEELGAIAAQIYDWQRVCIADSMNKNVAPMPSSLFRVGVLVSAYFPHLESAANQMSRSVTELHVATAQVALSKQPPSQAQFEATKKAATEVSTACVVLAAEIGRTLRAARGELARR